MTGRDLLLMLYDSGLSQRDLARRLCVSEQAVSAWVGGRKPIPVARQEQIREMLEARPTQPPPDTTEALTA